VPDYIILAMVIISVAVILGVYSAYIFFVLRRRREKSIYSIIFSSVAAHFSVWGVAEFYLLNYYNYFIGISYIQTVDKIYWIIAWFGSIIPIVVGFISIILVFLAGYNETKEELKEQYLKLLNTDVLSMMEKRLDLIKDIVSNVAFAVAGAHELFDKETKKKIFFKSILASVAGWCIGNILQDRICGLLTLFTLKPEYLTKFSELYWTLGGDLVAGLTQWILPLISIAIICLAYIYKR